MGRTDETTSEVRPLTLKEAANYTGFSVSHLRRRIASGKIKAVRFGHRVRVSRGELDDYLRAGE